MSKSNSDCDPYNLKFINLEKLENNLSLLHDIVLDDNFYFGALPNDCILKQVESEFLNSFWIQLNNEIESNFQESSCLVSIISYLRKKLHSLILKDSKSQIEYIDELLDVEHIQKRIRNSAFDMKQFSLCLINFIGSICAPIRDNQVNTLHSFHDPISFLKNVLTILDEMTIDLANYELKSMRPLIVAKSIEYENKIFNEFTQKSTDLLVNTKSWLEKSIENRVDIKFWLDKLNLHSNRLQYHNTLLVINGFLLLFTESIHLPETMNFDCNRIIQISVAFKRLVMSHQISSKICDFFEQKYGCESPHKNSIQSLKLMPKKIIEILLENNDIQFLADRIKESILLDCLCNSDCDQLYQLITDTIKSVNSSLSSFGSFLKKYILSIIISKMIDFFVNLSEYGFESDENQQFILFKQTITSIKPHIYELSLQIFKLINYNYSVYHTYYSHMINGILKSKEFQE